MRYNKGVSPRQFGSGFLLVNNLAQIADKGRHTSKQAAKAASLSLARHGRMPTFAVLGADTMWTIYALVDPRTCQIRYVGQTKKHPEVRLEAHIAKPDDNRAKRAWLEDLRRLSLKPVTVILEYVSTLEEALIVENLWIQRGKEAGWQLLNWGNTKPVRRKLKLIKVKKFRPQKTVPSRPIGVPATIETWYQWTLQDYLPSHLELLQVDNQGRGIGVMALAQTMAMMNGKDVTAMKGTASKVAKKIREDATLPGGAPLGVDISTGGAG
jgi:hypothetical protein